MTSRTAQDMQDHGVKRVAEALEYDGRITVFTEFAIPSHRPPPNQLMVHIDGYDYLITIEFQDPR